MSAWNYPVYTALPPVASAIAAGNCVILKPSELSPSTSNVLKSLFEKYLDKDCYQVIEGKAEIAAKITTYPFDLIIYTGSPEKGNISINLFPLSFLNNYYFIRAYHFFIFLSHT